MEQDYAGSLREIERPLLICFLIDVSGSMQSSIENRSGKTLSRLASLKAILNDLVIHAKTITREASSKGTVQIVKVFSYGFGLKLPNKEICDLLTLLRASHDLYRKEYSSHQSIDARADYSNGHEALARLARSYGYEAELANFAVRVLSSSDAGKLAQELEKDRKTANRLVSLIPKSFLGASAKVSRHIVAKPINFISNTLVEKDLLNDDIEEAKQLAFELIARTDRDSVEAVSHRIFQENTKRIVNRIDEIGDTTLVIEEVAEILERSRARRGNVDQIKALIYGKTPMRQALKVVSKRFQREWKNLLPETRSFLFILSDGIPTDGDPLPIAATLQNAGVTIMSCFVTNEDVTAPRVLYGKLNPHWTDGAQLMFHMASLGQESPDTVQFWKERNWAIRRNARLFVQINQSEILEEFLQGILPTINGRKRPI